MKIVIQDLPLEGLRVQGRERAATLGLSEDGVEGDVEVAAFLERDGATVFIEGEIRATFRFPCSRCLKVFHLPVDSQFSCRGEPADEMAVAVDVELNRGDLDVHPYHGSSLDLAEVFHEQVLLAMPMRPLCREDCLGLCSHCGEDLNLRRCVCSEAPMDSRLATLKKLMKNS